MNDIFKDMQAKVGCEYISDLPSYKRKVWHEMKRLNPADYEERQLEDFSKYVFGMSYQTLKDVMKQQKGREEQCRKQGCCCLRPLYDEYGNVYIVVDMELKGLIREALIKMILGFDIALEIEEE